MVSKSFKSMQKIVFEASKSQFFFTKSVIFIRFYMLEFCYCVTYMVSIWCIWQAARSMAGATDFSEGSR